MRITRNMMLDTVMKSVSDIQNKLFKTQKQIAESRKILAPSDNPVSTNRILINKAAMARNAQYQANIGQASQSLEITETILNQMTTLLADAEILANRGSTDTYGSDERHEFALDVSRKLEDLIHFSKTKHNGKYIFSGVQTLTAPFSTSNKISNEDITVQFNRNIELDNVHIKEGSIQLINGAESTTYIEGTDYTVDYKNGTITVLDTGSMIEGQNYLVDYETDSVSKVTINPKGIKGDIKYQIGDDATIKVNVTADELFLDSVNVFDKLLSLRNNLERDDMDAIRNSMTDFKNAMDNVINITGDVGNRINRLSMTSQFLSNENINLQNIQSNEQDVDVTEALLNLKALDMAYQTALSANAEIIKMNLLNLINI